MRASESEVPDNNNNYTSWPLRQLLSCVYVCDSYLLGRASSRKNKGNTTGRQNNEKQWNTEQNRTEQKGRNVNFIVGFSFSFSCMLFHLTIDGVWSACSVQRARWAMNVIWTTHYYLCTHNWPLRSIRMRVRVLYTPHRQHTIYIDRHQTTTKSPLWSLHIICPKTRKYVSSEK